MFTAPSARRRVLAAILAAASGAGLTACSTPSGSADAPTWSAGSTSAPASAAASATGVSSCVTRTLEGLSPEARAGQLLMIGTPVDSPGDLAGDLADLHLGGVFLAGRSTRKAAALKSDISELTAATSPAPLVALDQEGGSVQTLKGTDFPLLPSAKKLGAGSADELRDTVAESAAGLAGIGITINLAPVADTVPTDVGESNPPIGAFKRQYGSDPEQVAEAISTVVPASQDAGVLTVLKHFPGLGRTTKNTDVEKDVVDDETTADDPYLEPFKAGIEAGTAAVMMSSAQYPKLDDSTIAAYSSKIVTGLLREQLGFDGLVISDDLGAADAAAIVPVGERAVKFVAAGGDLALTIRPEDASPMAEALIAEARGSQEFAARVDESATRVLVAKERAGLLTCG